MKTKDVTVLEGTTVSLFYLSPYLDIEFYVGLSVFYYRKPIERYHF